MANEFRGFHRRVKRGIQAIVLPMAVVGGWWLACALGVAAPGTIPSPQEVVEGFVRLLDNGRYWQHVGISLSRVLGGFTLAAVIAVPAGILIGSQPGFRRVVSPTLEFLRQIPPVAWVPLFIVWLGLGEAPKLAVIAYAAFFPILLNTEMAVAGIAQEYEEVAASLCLSPRRRWRKLVLPAASLGIFTGLRLGLGMSWRALVAAEMLAAFSGLGYMIMAARSLVRLDEMFIGILSIGVFGLGVDWAGRRLQTRLLPWAAEGNKGADK
ncbi:MAG: ABC transporter permease [Firmicutes bacterium]|nr:ABC transporter permease [Bacillota bacterium]